MTTQARVRRRVAWWLYAMADRVNPPGREKDDTDATGWDISFTIWATEKVADEVFDRVSDAICGVDHHPLDDCPGPMFVGGFHPSQPDTTSNPARGKLTIDPQPEVRTNG